MPELTIHPPRFGFRALSVEEKDQIEVMSKDARVATMCAGRWTYTQCCHWAARWPHEVPLINGEFAFIAAFEAEQSNPRCDSPSANPSRRSRSRREDEAGG